MPSIRALCHKSGMQKEALNYLLIYYLLYVNVILVTKIKNKQSSLQHSVFTWCWMLLSGATKWKISLSFSSLQKLPVILQSSESTKFQVPIVFSVIYWFTCCWTSLDSFLSASETWAQLTHPENKPKKIM